jgi:hypothetical protein
MNIADLFKPLFFFLIGVSLTSCVTAGQIDQRLGGWVGIDADELVARWGAPNGTYEKKDGARVLTFDRNGLRTTGGPSEQTVVASHCKINFTTDKDNAIVAYNWSGEIGECDDMIFDAK